MIERFLSCKGILCCFLLVCFVLNLAPHNLKYEFILGQGNKKGRVALSNRPISKNKIKKKKVRVGNPPNFCQIGWVFSPFMRKKVENPPKCYTFECFFKKIIVKNPTDQPKYSLFPCKGNTKLFFTLKYKHMHSVHQSM